MRVWAGNARNQARLSEAAVQDLIDSILAEGGQKVPVVVRHVTGDPAHDYEVIAGTRRHFAIRWLRANNYPEMKLLAQVADLDDEAAFRLADIENRARKDVSDIERARNYAAALESHYGGKAVRMAERLKLSKGWLSKMLKAASDPRRGAGGLCRSWRADAEPGLCARDRARRQGARQGDCRRGQVHCRGERAAMRRARPLPGSAVLRR